jgi:hypothetical protein
VVLKFSKDRRNKDCTQTIRNSPVVNIRTSIPLLFSRKVPSFVAKVKSEIPMMTPGTTRGAILA